MITGMAGDGKHAARLLKTLFFMPVGVARKKAPPFCGHAPRHASSLAGKTAGFFYRTATEPRW